MSDNDFFPEFDLSPKVEAYFKKIEDETGFSVKLQYEPDLLSQTNHHACCATLIDKSVEHENEKLILILFDSEILINQREIDYTMAHEATHGYLTAKLKYPLLKGDDPLLCGYLTTHLQDIVVSKIVQDEGFEPYNDKFYSFLSDDVYGVRNRLPDIYAVPKWYTILRTVQMWGVRTYCSNKQYMYELMGEFINAVKSVFPEEYRIAQQIIEVFRKNDIFTCEGYIEILRYIISTYNLNIELLELQ